MIIPLVREDLWENFENMTILGKPMHALSPDDVIRYDPRSEGYDKVVSRLDTLAGEVLAHEDKKGVAVLGFTFNDITRIFEEASDETAYDNLTRVRFVGTDGNTLNPELVKSPVAAEFGKVHHLIGYTLYISDLGTSVEHDRMVEKLGYEPNGYVYASYDMAKIAAQTAFLHGSEEIEDLKKAVFQTANQFRGILAARSLNSAGDRIRTYYSFWKLEEDPEGTIAWNRSGIWEKINENRAPTLVNYYP